MIIKPALVTCLLGSIFAVGACSVGDGKSDFTSSSASSVGSAGTDTTAGTSSGTSAGTSGVSGDTEALTEPREGEWTLLSGDVITDECKVEPTPTISGGVFALSKAGPDTFEVTVPAYPTLTCTLTGTSFDCPDVQVLEIPLSQAVDPMYTDGTVTLSLSVQGSFTPDWDHIEGEQVITAQCTGADCDAAAMQQGTSFPCAITGEFTAISPFV